MVKNPSQRQQTLFTGVEKNSNLASSLCKICCSKPLWAFVEVVEGSEDCNFVINIWTHLLQKFWEKLGQTVPNRNVFEREHAHDVAPVPRRPATVRRHTCTPRHTGNPWSLRRAFGSCAWRCRPMGLHHAPHTHRSRRADLRHPAYRVAARTTARRRHLRVHTAPMPTTWLTWIASLRPSRLFKPQPFLLARAPTATSVINTASASSLFRSVPVPPNHPSLFPRTH
jgi:hypothetical protein